MRLHNRILPAAPTKQTPGGKNRKPGAGKVPDYLAGTRIVRRTSTRDRSLCNETSPARLDAAWPVVASGLRLGFRPETLSADALAQADSYCGGAGTVRILRGELSDSPLWRRHDADLAQSGVIGDIAGGGPVSVETAVSCLNPLVGSLTRSSGKFPDIGGLTVIDSLAAGGPPNLGDESVYILPDKSIARTNRYPLWRLCRPRAAAQGGA